jgi:hypothetical protein
MVFMKLSQATSRAANGAAKEKEFPIFLILIKTGTEKQLQKGYS